jgi:hypothetical protein
MLIRKAFINWKLGDYRVFFTFDGKVLRILAKPIAEGGVSPLARIGRLCRLLPTMCGNTFNA